MSAGAPHAPLDGLDQKETREFGQRCLLARRMVERGVRFVQVYSGDTNGWDAHNDVLDNHTKYCKATDKAVAGLLTVGALYVWFKQAFGLASWEDFVARGLAASASGDTSTAFAALAEASRIDANAPGVARLRSDLRMRGNRRLQQAVLAGDCATALGLVRQYRAGGVNLDRSQLGDSCR